MFYQEAISKLWVQDVSNGTSIIIHNQSGNGLVHVRNCFWGKDINAGKVFSEAHSCQQMIARTGSTSRYPFAKFDPLSSHAAQKFVKATCLQRQRVAG